MVLEKPKRTPSEGAASTDGKPAAKPAAYDTPSEAPSTAPMDLEKEQLVQQRATLLSLANDLFDSFPSTTQTITRLPIPLLPFAMCEFIMVRGIAQRGWIHIFAKGFAHICTTPAATVFFMGFFCATFPCPLAGTNIGAAIILVEIMRHPAFSRSKAVLDNESVLLGAIYAVAMGSNLGAFSFTFAGSLAESLWRALLYDSATGKIEVGKLKFARINVFPLMMQTSVACALVLGQLYWFA